MCDKTLWETITFMDSDSDQGGILKKTQHPKTLIYP